jgi:hypothetical protein
LRGKHRRISKRIAQSNFGTTVFCVLTGKHHLSFAL